MSRVGLPRHQPNRSVPPFRGPPIPPPSWRGPAWIGARSYSVPPGALTPPPPPNESLSTPAKLAIGLALLGLAFIL